MHQYWKHDAEVDIGQAYRRGNGFTFIFSTFLLNCTCTVTEKCLFWKQITYNRQKLSRTLLGKTGCDYCERQEESTILICALRMFGTSSGLPLKMNGIHRTQSDNARFDHISRGTFAKHSVEAKAF